MGTRNSVKFNMDSFNKLQKKREKARANGEIIQSVDSGYRTPKEPKPAPLPIPSPAERLQSGWDAEMEARQSPAFRYAGKSLSEVDEARKRAQVAADYANRAAAHTASVYGQTVKPDSEKIGIAQNRIGIAKQKSQLASKRKAELDEYFNDRIFREDQKKRTEKIQDIVSNAISNTNFEDVARRGAFSGEFAGNQTPEDRAKGAVAYINHKTQKNYLGYEDPDAQNPNYDMNGATAFDRARYDTLTEDEKNVVRYYAALGDYTSVSEYLDAKEPILNARAQAKRNMEMKQFAEKHPIAGSAVNIASVYGSASPYIANAIQMTKNAVSGEYVPTDKNSDAFANAHASNATAEGVGNAAYNAARDTFGSETAGNTARELSGIGLAIGQNAALIPLGKIGARAALTASAAGSSTLDALERGATPQQAFAAGTASGAIEWITEKLPIDRIFKVAGANPSGVKDIITNVLKQMGTEAGEESISNIAGNIADRVIMGDKSNYELLVAELVKQGISREEAEKQAFTQLYVVDTLKSAAGGAISGGVMGAGASAVGMARGRAAHNTANRAIDNAYNEMRENGMFGDRTKDALDIARDARIVDREFNGGYTESWGVMNNEETNSTTNTQTGKEAASIANSRAGEAIDGASKTGEDTGRSGGQNVYGRGFDASVSNLAENRKNAIGTINRGGKTEVLELQSSRNGNRYKFAPIEPKTDIQRRIIDQSIKDRVNVYFIDSAVERIKTDGTTESISWKGGLHLGNGNILLNGDGDSYYHEIFHEIEERNPDDAKKVIDRTAFSANMGSEAVRQYLQDMIDGQRRLNSNFTDEKVWNEICANVYRSIVMDYNTSDWDGFFTDWESVRNDIVALNKSFSQQNAQASEKSGVFSMPENEESSEDTTAQEKQNNQKKGIFNKPLGAVDKDSMLAAGAVKQLGRKFYQNVVSAQAPLERAAKVQDEITPNRVNLAESVQQVRTAGGIVDSILDDGMSDIDGNRIGESWVSLTDQIPQGKEELFSDYMLHRHHIERVKHNKPVLKTTAEESERFVKRVDAEHPEFQDVAKKIHEYWDMFMRKWAVEGNLMSEEALNSLEEKYPNYVPTFRKKFDGAFSSKSRGRKIEIATPIKNATGDISDIKDIRDGFAEYINKIVRAERKNELFLNLLDFARRSPATASNYVVIAEPEDQQERISAMDILDIDEANKKSLQEIDDGVYEVTALENGEPVTMYVSQEVFKALDALINPNITTAQKLGRKITSIPKALITGKNFFFGLFNTIRDLQSGRANSIVNNPVKFVQQVAKAAYEIKKNSEGFQQYKALGGARSGFFSKNDGFVKSKETAYSKKKSIDNTLRKIDSKVFAFNNVSEQMVRYAEYKNYLQKHGDTPDNRRKAALAAADITVNFARSAPLTKTADAWVMYLNAGVQGIDKMARQIKSRPVSTLLKGGLEGIIVSEVLGRIIPMLLGIAGNDENPYYEELDNRTKDNYYIVPNILDKDESGIPKTFIKIPKSREYGVLLVAAYERAARLVRGEKPDEAFDGFWKSVLTSIATANPFEDNIYTPILNAKVTNKDFAGRTIVPESMKNLDPELQYDARTSEVAKYLGRKFKASPKKIDYLIDSYTGIIGDMLQPATTGKYDSPAALAASIFLNPIKSKFTADPLYSSKSVNQFYEDYEKAENVADSKNVRENIPSEYKTPEEVRVSHYLAVSKEIASLRNEEKQLLDEMPNNVERKKKIDAIRSSIVTLAKNAKTDADRVVAEYEKTYVPEISMLSGTKQEAARTAHDKYNIPYEDFKNLVEDTLALPIVDGKQNAEEGKKKYMAMLSKKAQEHVKNTSYEETAADLRRYVLNEMGGLTPEQKAFIDEVVSGERKNKVDYSDDGSFYLSQLSESKQGKYEEVKSRWSNISKAEYCNIINEVNKLGKNPKKDDIIAKLKTLGFSGDAPYQFYSIVFAPKKK